MLEKIKNKINYEINRKKVIRKRISKLKTFSKTCFTVFLVPNQDVVNGGVLSIASLHKEFCNLKSSHNTEVLALNHKYNSTDFFFKFSKFDNEMKVFDWHTFLDTMKVIDKLTIHIPELFLSSFIDEVKKDWSKKHKLKLDKVKDLRINVLNQNDLLMPEVTKINWLRKHLTQDITMTMAHRQYATLKNREKYGVPMHYLSAWLNPVPFEIKRFEDKKKIIMFSPDELTRANIKSKHTIEDLQYKIKSELSGYEIITVKNMKYEEYKKLASAAMFTVTLGEGLDGYFLDTVFSGGISFAVYNEEFFTRDYKDLQTVYVSFEDMFENIIRDFKSFNIPLKYDDYNLQELGVLEIEYSYSKFQNRVREFIKGNYDFK